MADTEFLNIDLDIESKENVDEIVGEFALHFYIMNNEKRDGIYYASFETHQGEENKIIEKVKNPRS